jgi:hypothetical protein
MSNDSTRYDDLLEELRLRYKRKYNKNLDDEILYIIIRLNEMQLDHKKDFLQLRKDLTGKPKISFTRGKDYFFYGMGQTATYGLVWLISLVVCACGFYLLHK